MERSVRYHRQIVLPQLGESGQKALKESRVLIVGMGALGSPAAFYLASAGVGQLGLMDPDLVDLTNLQRQILYRTSDQGSFKVEKARDRILELNPEVGVSIFPKALMAHNALEIFKKFDLVVDGTDNFSAKFLINDAAYKLGIPVVFGAVSQFEGQVSVFWGKKGPCYRCLYSRAPEQWIPNCAEAGVLGAVTGVIGSAQALEAIKVLVKMKNPESDFDPLMGSLWMWDGVTFSSRKMAVQKKEDCSVCSKVPEDVKLEDLSFFCSSDDQLSWEEFHLSSSKYCLWDVREENEWNDGHHPLAKHHPLSLMESGILPKKSSSGKIDLLYCESGVRSLKAVSILKERGHTNVMHIPEGFLRIRDSLKSTS